VAEGTLRWSSLLNDESDLALARDPRHPRDDPVAARDDPVKVRDDSVKVSSDPVNVRDDPPGSAYKV
jgi:hypothetical protein